MSFQRPFHFSGEYIKSESKGLINVNEILEKFIYKYILYTLIIKIYNIY